MHGGGSAHVASGPAGGPAVNGLAQAAPGRDLAQWLGVPTSAHPACPRCKQHMVLKSSANGLFWGCGQFPTCTGIVRAQPGGWPLPAVPATQALRAWRRAAHNIFDLLWCTLPQTDQARAREAAYRWLAQVLTCAPEEAHIGLCSRPQCLRILVATILRLGRVI